MSVETIISAPPPPPPLRVSIGFVSDYLVSTGCVSDYLVSIGCVSDYLVSIGCVSDYLVSIAFVSDYRESIGFVSDYLVSIGFQVVHESDLREPQQVLQEKRVEGKALVDVLVARGVAPGCCAWGCRDWWPPAAEGFRHFLCCRTPPPYALEIETVSTRVAVVLLVLRA